jgi:hypothetical protein
MFIDVIVKNCNFWNINMSHQTTISVPFLNIKTPVGLSWNNDNDDIVGGDNLYYFDDDDADFDDGCRDKNYFVDGWTDDHNVDKGDTYDPHGK